MLNRIIKEMIREIRYLIERQCNRQYMNISNISHIRMIKELGMMNSISLNKLIFADECMDKYLSLPIYIFL